MRRAIKCLYANTQTTLIPRLNHVPTVAVPLGVLHTRQ